MIKTIKVAIFTMCSFNMLLAFAQDINVSTIANGACWFEYKDDIKIVSFNDKEALHTNREAIEIQFRSLLNQEDTTDYLSRDITLHCGGYGASLVIKTKVEGKPACAWLSINKGELQLRSFGALENTQSPLCHGHKWGELLVLVKDKNILNDFVAENLNEEVLKIEPVVGQLYKIVLNETFKGKETDVADKLKKSSTIRSVEFNNFQHPVGDFIPLK